MNSPLRIAHRVRSVSDLDNALASEVNGIEIDVRMSRDGVLMVKHGRRYTNAYGRKSWVDKVPFADIEASSRSKITTLDSFLSALSSSGQPDLILDLDIKQAHMEKHVHALLRKHRMFSQMSEIIISSADVWVLEAYNRLSERYQLSLTFAPNDRFDLMGIRFFKYLTLILQYTFSPLIYRMLRRKSRHREIQYANVHYRMIDENLLGFLHDQHIKVLAYHATSKRHIRELERLGVDGIKVKL